MLNKILNYSTWVVTLLLSIGAVGLLVVATPLFGNKALIVRSGSMEPAISVGDLVVVRLQAEAYNVGQVISYKLPDHQNMVVTHRISDVSNGDLRTKGDANNEADGYLVKPDQVLGKEVLVVPYVGKFLAFAKSKVGFGLLVILPAIVVILGEGFTIVRELRRNPLISPLSSRRENAMAGAAGGNAVLSLNKGSLSAGRQGKEGFSDGTLELPTNMLFPSAWVSRPLRRPLLMDSISRRLVIFLAAIAMMTPATWAQYSDTAQSTNNVFMAATDFGGPSPTPTPTPTPSVTPSPSPSPSPTPSPTPGPGDVVINEVMWMGSTVNSNDEWIELRNLTASPVDLTDWQVINGGAGSSHIILSGTIPGNGFFLISNFVPSNAQSALKDSLTADAQANVSLLETGEQLTLQNAVAVAIDRTPVAPGWAAGTDTTLKQSMERNLTPGDGTVVGSWHTCTDASCNDTAYWDAEANNYGTPKAENL